MTKLAQDGRFARRLEQVAGMTDNEPQVRHFVMPGTYAPSDFTGNQAFERELSSHLIRTDVPFGFKLIVRVAATDDVDQSMWCLYYAYDMPHESIVPDWAEALQGNVESWLRDADVGDECTFQGPKGVVSVTITLDDRGTDPSDRSVRVLLPTKSTDTQLYFDVGDAETTAHGPWGSNITDKLAKRQAGAESPKTLRMLVVNFALADAAERDFINSPPFAKRFTGTVDLVASPLDLPYDVVVPAHLGRVIGFGSAVILNERRRAETEAFIRQSGLDVPVKPYASEDETLQP